MYIIKMPQVKPTTQKGTIVQWLKQEGSSVKRGDLLVTIETDDGLVELESGLVGTLRKILSSKGTTVGVGAPIAELDEGGQIAEEKKGPVATMQNTVIPVVMPKAGQSMEEGTILKWRVAVGARIKKGDVIFEIETDKATLEVEAVDEGRLARIVVPEGETVKVLDAVGYLAENDKDVDTFLGSRGQEEKIMSNVQLPISNDQVKKIEEKITLTDGRVKASPAARKIAGERGVDLVGIGSGPGGRILSTDVLVKGTKEDPSVVIGGEAVRKRMSGMRKAIARNLLFSKQNIPHFYMKLTVNAEPMYAFYQQEKAKYPCSLNDLVVMSCAKAIMEFPAFRSKIDKEEIVEFQTANIGIAVGMDEGLVVPVLVGAERMTLRQIDEEIKRIAAAARSGKIEGMGKGVFTITNLGMFGVEEFSGIINPPEASILAVGALREDVLVSGGAIRAGRVMTLTLSADHRIIDGMLAGKFMAKLKEILENFGLKKRENHESTF
ncbi:MAG: 2-oxo acid dehydrogenase subunit E2 [Phycisphaerae bacterium]